MDWTPILNLLKRYQDLAAIATFVSLIIACVQWFLAWRQTKHLKQIQESISTKYIGDLTKYYPEVISLIEDAKESIVILCDYPAYGCFTNSTHWHTYFDLLFKIKAKGKVSIVLTCPKDDIRRKTDETVYFPKTTEEDWSNWKKVHQNRKRLRRFLLNTPSTNQHNIAPANVERFIDNLSRESLLELLQLADNWMLQKCCAEGDENLIESSPPIDLWIVDGMTAIFALTNYQEGMSRYGFKTIDHKLIDALQKTYDNYSLHR